LSLDNFFISETENPQTVTATITTEGYADGEVFEYLMYADNAIGDLEATDITGSPEGTVTIQDNSAQFSFTLREDFLIEGDESITIAVWPEGSNQRGLSLDVLFTEEKTYDLSLTPAALSEGGTAVATITTANVEFGSQVAWTITGVSEQDLEEPSSLTGNVTINQIGPAIGEGIVNIEIAEDAAFEGNETLTFTIDANGTNRSISITDTSTGFNGGNGGNGGANAATYSINADESIIYENLFTPRESTVNITTTNVPAGTVLSWTIGGEGITTGDYAVNGVIPTTLTGTVTINSIGTASVELSAVNDLISEGIGIEDLTFTLDGTGQSVDISIIDL